MSGQDITHNIKTPPPVQSFFSSFHAGPAPAPAPAAPAAPAVPVDMDCLSSFPVL